MAVSLSLRFISHNTVVFGVTLSNSVLFYPLTKFDSGLKLLHDVDHDAVIWLESTATTALMKWNETYFLSIYDSQAYDACYACSGWDCLQRCKRSKAL